MKPLVLVCGGRKTKLEDEIIIHLDAVLNKHPEMTLLHGGAPGTDTIAEKWAKERQVMSIRVPAKWNEHKMAAGPIRNKRMLDMKPDAVVAFPGGAGTAHMVKIAKEANVPIWHPIK